MHPAVLGLTFAVVATSVAAQAPTAALKFEVASIRENKSGSGASFSSPRPGGNYTASTMTLRSLVWVSYRIPRERVIGGPGWVDTVGFDIAAKAGDNASPIQMNEMLKSLLAERFHLVARQEQRELPVYALVIARRDGTFGPRFRANPLDCADRIAVQKVVEALPSNAVRPCMLSQSERQLRGGVQTVNALADKLSQIADRPVVNRTGLTGTFDFDLDWAATPDADGVSVFTAVQEQLGLRLEPSTAPLDVVVIESAQRPSDN